MSFEQRMEKQTELNDIFKSNTMNIVNPDGKIYVGREHVGCYVAVVVFALHRSNDPLKGVVKNKKLDKCDILVPEIITMFSSNPQITPREVARSLGVDVETINRAVGKINLKEPGKIKVQLKDKLWLDIVPRVREIMDKGTPKSKSEIARQLNVHRDTVAKAVEYIKQNKNEEPIKA